MADSMAMLRKYHGALPYGTKVARLQGRQLQFRWQKQFTCGTLLKCTSESVAEQQVEQTSNSTMEPATQPSEQGKEYPSTPKGSRWELDFCSRPLVDEKGKKVWELLICDPNKQFVYSIYLDSKKINSQQLKKQLQIVLDKPGAEKPQVVKFFRSQMASIIQRALDELDIMSVPSRRCVALIDVLNERIDTVYKRDPRYDPAKKTLFQFEARPPEEISREFMGEMWFFSQLPLFQVMEELRSVEEGIIWGDTLPPFVTANLPVDLSIPGVVVLSTRAESLAAWTHSLELAACRPDLDVGELVLETDANRSWRYGPLRVTQESVEVANMWERAKFEADGLHYLAVIDISEQDTAEGFWLLQEKPMPNV